MKSRVAKSRPRGSALGRLMVPALISLSLGVVGCAHNQGSEKDETYEEQKRTIEKLESRLEEVERTNGRLNVRLEELEEQLFLVQDMSESNRLALKRGNRRPPANRDSDSDSGGDAGDDRARAEAPDPPTESYYDEGESPYGEREQNDRQGSKRDVTRIPLSDQQSGASERPSSGEPDPGRSSQASKADERSSEAAEDEGDASDQNAPDDQESEELVISEEDFREFSGESASGQGRKDAGPATREQEAANKAQPPVTNEKLGDSEADKEAEDEEDDQGDDSGSSDSGGDSGSGDSEVERAVQEGTEKDSLEMYKAALSDYRDGNYNDALDGFRTFLEAGPNPNYLDNALYWIGECNYGLGDYDKAIEYFERVLDEQPDGNKVPDAMLKMSMAHEQRGEEDRARKLLEKVTERYPSTNAGRLGEKKLSEFDDE